jgi:3-hydroxyisobutyrate dehydrogenase-like beta-hydroxyacid dehydrogenase
MGAAIGARLAANGLKVLTSLVNRSAASAARAAAARLEAASDVEITRAEFLLSIVPPKEAVGLAERLAPALAAANRKPVYVDCNAISPETTARVDQIITGTGAAFVDGGIVGGPPRDGYAGPRFYVSGPGAARVTALNEYGLTVRVVDGPIGAASALKLSYAGINKGLIAIGAAMVLAARRAGVEDALMRELSESQGAVLARLARGVPDMFAKAERWAPELDEIASYAAREGDAQIFAGMARLYERLAEDLKEGKDEIGVLDEFFDKAQR